MAIIMFEGQEVEVPEGEKIISQAESLGMPFGCTDGLCGTCRCTVVAGQEYLPPKNEKEEDMGLDNRERLVCQLTITGGKVEFSID